MATLAPCLGIPADADEFHGSDVLQQERHPGGQTPQMPPGL